MDNYQEYIRKSKEIDNQQEQMKRKKKELKRQKLKLLMDRIDKRKEDLQKNIVDVNRVCSIKCVKVKSINLNNFDHGKTTIKKKREENAFGRNNS